MINSLRAEFRQLAAKLEEKGTKLRPAASEETLMRLQVALGGALSLQARALFSTFDGFDDQSPGSDTMIYLWPVEEIIGKLAIPIGRIQAIADYFLDAEFLSCDLRSDDACVWWESRNAIASKDLLEFCRLISRGTLAP